MAKKNKKQSSQAKAKLIYNPGAGDHADSNARLEQAVRTLAGHNITVDVALAKPKEAATPIARAAAKAGYKLVIAMGGDGTIEAVAQGLIGTKTRLGMIPGGTVNNMAKALAIPVDFEGACSIIEAGYERRIDVGRIKVKGKKKAHYFFEAAGIGLTGTLFPKGKDIGKGKLGQIKDVIGTLINYQTPKIYLTFDNESQIKVDTLLVTIANGPVFGLTFRVAPNASLEDGLLDVCTYPNFSKAELVAYFASVAQGGESNDQRVQRYRARKIKLKCKPPLDAIADAEPVGTGNFNIQVMPGALRMITPQQTGLAQQPSPETKQLPLPVAPTTPPSEAAKPDQASDQAQTQEQAEVGPKGESKSPLKKIIEPVAAGAAAIVDASVDAISRLQDKKTTG